MKAFLQVLGACTGDTPGNVLLFFDETRYLFECGDGTQRFCNSHRVRIASGKLRNVFLTSLSPSRSIGGLLGMLLTVADAGVRKLSIVAPPGLETVFSAARTFFYRPSLSVDINSVPTTQPVLKDENLTVTAVALPYATGKKRPRAGSPTPGPVLAYHCKLHDLPGRFNPTAARELGVPPGPLYSRLVRGESVTVPSRTEPGTQVTVTPAQVIAKGTPGPTVVVVAVPHRGYLDALLSDDASILTARQQDAQHVCVVHMTPRHVAEDQRYRDWCDRFQRAGPDEDTKTTHIALHESFMKHAAPTVLFAAQADSVAKLDRLGASKYFPMSSEGGLGASEAVSAPTVEPPLPLGWTRAEALLQFVLAPADKIGMEWKEVKSRQEQEAKRVKAVPEDVEANNNALNEFPMMRRLAEFFNSDKEVSGGARFSVGRVPESLRGLPEQTAKIRFLGTGSAIPGAFRNVSSILLDLFQRGTVLIDAGEATFGQLVRSLGWKGAENVIRQLRMIWISHMHADHHLGLLSILERRLALEDVDRPLLIVGPAPLEAWLTEISQVLTDPVRFMFFDNSKLVHPEMPEAHYFSQNLGIRVEAVEVIHCPYAYALILEDCIYNWKIAYSGDTRPCRRFAERAKDATVIIHEATMATEMQEEAREKYHSTTREALEVARVAGAYRTILTHFSQRFKVPAFHEAELLAQRNSVIAYDFFEVDLVDLPRLPASLPALMSLYPALGGNEIVDDPDQV